jgi:N-acetylglutamate synthase-like GNAT family acetyltransferase
MAQLAYLQVSAPYRRRGIATAITQRLLDLARAHGASNVYVSATPSQPTVAFYQKFGFSPAAEPLPELYELEPEDIHMTLQLEAIEKNGSA